MPAGRLLVWVAGEEELGAGAGAINGAGVGAAMGVNGVSEGEGLLVGASGPAECVQMREWEAEPRQDGR
jgi:hypothetical protein